MGYLEKILKAFANRRRIAIVHYLKKHREASVGEIAAAIRLSLKATSKHLAILFAADIIEKDQRILQMFYRITGDTKPLTRTIIKFL